MADFNSERQEEARKAYGDAEQSKRVHGKMMETFNVEIRKNSAMLNRAAVLGVLGGLCTAASAMGIASGAPHLLRGLTQSDQAAKVLAWSVTSGLGLAFAVTVSFVNERVVYDLELERELWEIDNHLSGELLEMIAIYRSQGLTEEDAHTVTRIFAKQKQLFAALMMVEELGYSRLQPPTAREVITNAALPAIAGYVVGLVAPVLPVLLMKGSDSGGGGGIAGTSSDSVVRGSRALGGAMAFVARHARRLAGAALLAGLTALQSYAQSEVFFGAYAQHPIFRNTLMVNTAGVGAVYALSYAIAKVT